MPLFAYASPPQFVDDVDQPLGAADLNVLIDNAVLLDAASFRAPQIMASSAGKDTDTPGYYVGVSGERIWWGSFQFQTGMTTLTIEGWAQKGASESFLLKVNGSTVSTTAVPNGAAFTLTWTITGITNGDIVEVEIDISGTGWGGSGVATKYVIYDAYANPAPSIATSWPGSPTFAGTYNTTRLNQLINRAAYLYDRLNALPLLPILAQFYAHGSSVTGDTYPIWWGAVERANGNNTLNAWVLPLTFGNVSESWRVVVNGSTVHSSSSFGSWQHLQLDLSAQAANTRLETKIEHVVTTGPTLGPSGDRNSRFHLGSLYMFQTAPAVGTAPAHFESGESLASTAVDTRLNAVASLLSAAKTRLDNNPRIFDRVRLMRRMYGRNADQYSVFGPHNTYVQQFQRTGSRLIVRGKAVRVLWGQYSTKADKTTTGAYGVDFAHSQQLTEGDTVQTKEIYLDTLEGLHRGQTYHVAADEALVYAAERLV